LQLRRNIPKCAKTCTNIGDKTLIIGGVTITAILNSPKLKDLDLTGMVLVNHLATSTFSLAS
ncbi:hypothetical protein, partial [Pseudomonas viridiflava]